MPVYRKSLGDAGTLAPGGSPTGGQFYGAGGSWVNVGGCFFGRPEDWPAFQRTYLCSSPYSSCTVPCPSDTCGGGNAAACPGYSAPAAPAAPPPSPYNAAPKSPTDTEGKVYVAPKITVETSEGPVDIAADFVPGVSDGALVPVQVRIPNVWDSLDPSKVSQFEYRGLATSLPVWISDRWRQTLATAAGAVTPGSPIPGAGSDPVAVDGEIPLWVWAAIGAAAWMMRTKSARAVAHKRRAA